MRAIKSGMLKKMFLSYVGLLIPLFIILLAAFHGISEEYKRLDDSRLSLAVNQVIEAVDKKYRDLLTKGAQLSSMRQLSPSDMLQGESFAQEGVRVLSQVCSYDKEISDCFVSYNTGTVYSLQGSTSMDTWVKKTLGCSGTDEEKMRELIGSDRKGIALSGGKSGSGGLVFHFPMGKTLNSREGSVNFCMSAEEFAQLLTPLLQVEELYVRIRLDNGQALYLNGSGEEGFSAILEEEFPCEQGREQWIVKEIDMEDTGIAFRFCWKYSSIYADVTRYHIALYVLLSALMVLSGLVAFRISLNYYRKTEQVVRLVGPGRNGIRREYRDEWEFLQEAVRGIVRENDASKTIIEEYRTIVRQQGAMELLHGTYTNVAQAEKLLEACGQELYGEYYAVCLICGKDGREPQIKRENAGMMQEEIYCCDQLKGCMVYEFLLQMPNDDEGREGRKQQCGRLTGLFAEERDELAVIISNVYEKKHMIAYAWMETMERFQEFVSSRELPELFFCTRKLEVESRQRIEEDEELGRFDRALTEKDADAAKKALASLVREEGPDREKLYYRCFCLLRYMITFLQNQDSEKGAETLEKVSALNLGDTAAFLSGMQEAVEEICSRESDPVMENILEYIRNNFQRNDFSLENVAAQFGLSKTYVSRLFKKRLGIRYIDYLSGLRMEEARKKLLETDLTIQEIAESVGYFDVPGFRKKFKQTYGINASQYRKTKGI